MPDLRIDASELDALARDFALAGAKVIPAIVPTAHRAGNNIKRVMKSDATGHAHLPGLPRYVEYDIETTATSVTVDVGFRKEGQGSLANIAAFGTADTPALFDVTAGLTDEVPNFMRWVAKVGAEAL